MRLHCLLISSILLINISCSKEKISPQKDNSSQNDEHSNSTTKDFLPWENGPFEMKIKYLNHVGSGFNFEEILGEDWDGDGLIDLMCISDDGLVRMYKGRNKYWSETLFNIHQSSSANYVFMRGDHQNGTILFPDKYSNSTWKLNYKFVTSNIIGSGFQFSQYHTGDFNGDGIKDLVGMHTNGTMFLYTYDNYSLASGIAQINPEGGNWNLNARRVAGDFNGDGFCDFIEFYSKNTISKYSAFNISYHYRVKLGNGNGTYSDQGEQNTLIRPNFKIFPIDIDIDGKIDLCSISFNGILYKLTSNGSTFATETSIGSGWDSFTDVYPGYNWSWHDTKVASLTARKPNGDLYLYKSDSFGTFNVGKKIGTGWNGKYLFTKNVLHDYASRGDYLLVNPDGNIHAYALLGKCAQ